MEDASEAWLRAQQQQRKVPISNANVMAQNPAGLSGVTGAVRDHMNNASASEKSGTSGQQKWGLFETNYQRTKGITTEQSLQEIEAFVGAQNAQPGTTTSSGSAQSQAGSGSQRVGKQGGDAASSSGDASSHGRPLTAEEEIAAAAKAGGPTKSTGARIGTGLGKGFAPGNAGSEFFDKFQQKEAAKYKPRGDFTKDNH
eukprot:c21616_g1_i1.p1 GENE.c21616_g1_i1~~c21616_g1_i1.p1  ORF type:complete len:199 (+),score=40.47 c21616_g1_i1:30-626(+)